MHSNKSRPEHDVLERELKAGRDLACRTLASVLERDTPVQWGNAQIACTVTRDSTSRRLTRQRRGHG